MIDIYDYTDMALGMTYTPEGCKFRVYSPIRDEIDLIIYFDSTSDKHMMFPMVKSQLGVFEILIRGNLKGLFYNYRIEGKEVTDPYSISVSMNSQRSAIVDLKDTNPEGWEEHTIPYFRRNCDAIVYELHIKDYTGLESSNVENRGKYLGLVEEGTTYNGLTTGLDHLKELGVTHIHIMPVNDFITVDESPDKFLDDKNYNWGYDPELYNVPEGSYATKPQDPVNRIKELKEMIMKLHEAGFKVILDVVYNHTFKTQDSNFHVIIPNYYHRVHENGEFSNGSGVGNEIASEKPMVRKFIVDSLMYWVEEYKVDGFRFDLMALMDIETVEEAISKMREKRPDIFIYGEPWTGGMSMLPHDKTTTKGRQSKLSFAFFNDEFRDAIKGNNDGDSRGFVFGNIGVMNPVETGITGSIFYDNGHIGFTSHPRETINYVNSHDNLIITDKIRKTLPDISQNDLERLNKLIFSILLTAQGIPLIHEGNEFLRDKNMHYNTYNAGLEINGIDWSLKEKNKGFYNYFKDLIKLRQSYKVFRMTSPEEIRKRLKFIFYHSGGNLITYTLMIGDRQKYLLIMHNGNFNDVILPKNVIINHIKEQYNDDVSDINMEVVLSLDGLDVDKHIDGKSHGIEIPYFSTKIYEITKK